MAFIVLHLARFEFACVNTYFLDRWQVSNSERETEDMLSFVVVANAQI